MVNEGDILQKGLDFYRVYSVSIKDIVMNKVIFNHIKNSLQLYKGYNFASWEEIENKYYTVLKREEPETIKKLELIKRKHKLNKLNILNEEI